MNQTMNQVLLILYTVLGLLGLLMVAKGRLKIRSITFTQGKPALIAGLLLMGSLPLATLIHVDLLFNGFLNAINSDQPLWDIILFFQGDRVIDTLPWLYPLVIGVMTGLAFVVAVCGCPFSDLKQRIVGQLNKIPHVIRQPPAWLVDKDDK